MCKRVFSKRKNVGKSELEGLEVRLIDDIRSTSCGSRGGVGFEVNITKVNGENLRCLKMLCVTYQTKAPCNSS
jgi:RNase P/RNase MRP subunit p29